MLIVQPVQVRTIPYGPSNVWLVLPDFLRKKFAGYRTCIPFASPLHIFPALSETSGKYQQYIRACPGQSDPERASFIMEHMEAITMIKRQYIDINEVIESYLPMSKKKARKFVIRYLDHKRIGNKIYVDRIKLEELLKREDVESLPLD